MEYEVELTYDDVGEMITILRVQVFKIHTAPFAEKLGIQERVLIESEEGKGPHGMKILQKINKMYNNVDISLNVKIKEGI